MSYLEILCNNTDNKRINLPKVDYPPDITNKQIIEMLDFSNTMNNHHFALNDVELRILQPVFLEFHAKTGLSIDEYGDTRLIPQNLELLINLANDYIKTLDKQSMKIVIEFIKNLRPMIIDKNTIWVSGD